METPYLTGREAHVDDLDFVMGYKAGAS